MILGMTTFTLVHVVLSLIAIVTGVVVVAGLLTANRFSRWTAVFLASALATSVTGFGFPLTPFLPSHVIGIISLVVLAVAAVALYVFHLAGAWRWLYVLSAVTLLYFNVFILVVQLFRKVPTLHALAPTESEPPLLIAQAVVLAVFVALAIAGTIKFHSRPRLAA